VIKRASSAKKLKKLADFRQILAEIRQMKNLAEIRQNLAETWQMIKIIKIRRKKKCQIRKKAARNLQLLTWTTNNISADHLKKYCHHLKGSSDQH